MPRMYVGDPAPLPRFCCVFLKDSRGRYVLEQRPLTESDAPGKLTCFGGGREPHEEPEACLRREVREELGCEIGPCTHVLTLNTPLGHAWFYEAVGPAEGEAAATEPGYTALWIDETTLRDPVFFQTRVADWHCAAFTALWRGERFASV